MEHRQVRRVASLLAQALRDNGPGSYGAPALLCVSRVGCRRRSPAQASATWKSPVTACTPPGCRRRSPAQASATGLPEISVTTFPRYRPLVVAPTSCNRDYPKLLLGFALSSRAFIEVGRHNPHSRAYVGFIVYTKTDIFPPQVPSFDRVIPPSGGDQVYGL